MKVAFNNIPLKSGHNVRGIGFYTRTLLAELKERVGIQLQEFSDLSEVKETDVVHYPFFDLFNQSLSISKKFSTVVTIHDVTPLIFKEHYPPGIKGALNNFFQKRSVRSAKAIITDSISSKNDIVKYLGVDPKKVFPIYIAQSQHFKVINDEQSLNMIKEKYNLPDKFALFVGNVNWNKNLLNIGRACKKAGIDLVLAGKGFEQKENLDHPELKSYDGFLKEFGSEKNVHILGFISDEDIVLLYNLATLALLPSFYEGFGLPILEAQACGVPIITSNLSSMPEIAGDGALLVNPYNVDAIEKAIVDILSNQTLKNELIKKGFKNIQRFSWNKVADETISVYHKAIFKK